MTDAVTDALLEELLSRTHESLSHEELLTLVKTGHAAIMKSIEKINRDNIERDELIAKLTQAFPDGDLSGHARYHKAKIDNKKEFARIRMVIYEKTATGIVWAILAFIGAAIWNHFVVAVHRGGQ